MPLSNSKNESPSKLEIGKPSKYPVTIRLDEDDLPELTKWKVGGKYKLTMEVEQISMSKGDEYGEMEPGSKNKTRASFKVLSVSPLGGSSVKDAKRPSMLSDALKKRV